MSVLIIGCSNVYTATKLFSKKASSDNLTVRLFKLTLLLALRL